MIFKSFKTTLENGTVSNGKRLKKSGYSSYVGAVKGSVTTVSTIRPKSFVKNVIRSILLTWNISLQVSMISVIIFSFILAPL